MSGVEALAVAVDDEAISYERYKQLGGRFRVQSLLCDTKLGGSCAGPPLDRHKIPLYSIPLHHARTISIVPF